MKQLFIVANFKSHKTRSQMEDWVNVFEKHLENLTVPEEKKIVLAPNLASLMLVTDKLLDKENVALAVQDISPFPAGAYTGAISGENLEGFHVAYAIVGHSERREYFHEDESTLRQKVEQAHAFKIKTIYCVQDKMTNIPDTVSIVAYEPISAIGSGHPDTPENADEIAVSLKQQHPQLTAVLYGGSVDKENVHTFTAMDHIDGVLIGGASLDADTFIDIVTRA